MLDRSAVLTKIGAIQASQSYGREHQMELAALRTAWSLYGSRIETLKPEPLDHTSPPGTYHLIAVDGSQVYPDRSMGLADVALVNTGGLYFCYTDRASIVSFFSEPEIVTRHAFEHATGIQSFVPTIIDMYRSCRELEHACDQARKLSARQEFDTTSPCLIMIDGPLYLTALGHSAPAIADYFLARWTAALRAAHQEELWCVGYTSAPRSRELIARLSEYDPALRLLDCVDADLMQSILEPGAVSPLFQSKSTVLQDVSLVWCYAKTLQGEVIKLDLLGSQAHVHTKLNSVLKLVFDQIAKGFGYPIALAEAHQHVVISEADRLFFIQQFLERSQREGFASRKALSKRVIPV